MSAVRVIDLDKPFKKIESPLKSIPESLSEENANEPQCRHGAFQNEDSECLIGDVQKCIRLEREEEYGVVDERDYRAGRGMPR